MDVDAFTHEGIVQRCFQRYGQEQGLRSCVSVLREEGPSRFRLPQDTQGPRQGTVQGFEERRQPRKRQEEAVQGQVQQVWQDGSHVEGLQIQRTSAFETGEEGLAENGCVEVASIDLHALEVGEVQLPEKDPQDSCWDRIVCCSECVPEDGSRQLPDAPNARQSNELEAGVRQASVRQPQSGGHAQNFDGGVRDERRCARTTRAVAPSWSSRE